MITRLLTCNAHVDLQMVDRPFYDGSDLVEIIPFIGVALKTGEHAKIHVIIGVGGASFFSRTARFFTVANILPLDHPYFRTAPFNTVGTSFLFRDTAVFHIKRRVVWAGGVSKFIKTDLFECAFIAWIVGDQHFLKAEIVSEKTVGLSRVKRRVTKESIRMHAYKKEFHM